MKVANCLCSAALALAVAAAMGFPASAQQTSDQQNGGGFPKVVFRDTTFGVQGSPRTIQAATTTLDVDVSDQLKRSSSPSLPGARVTISTSQDAPPACGATGGLCQLYGDNNVRIWVPSTSFGASADVTIDLPPAPGVPRIPGRLNVRSTRVDRVVVAQRAVDSLWRDAPLPDIKLGINPDPGLVGMWHFFWVNNYQGQPLVFPLHLDLPWTLFWQEEVTDITMECDDASCVTRHARTSSHLEDHSAIYVDTIDETVTLSPAEFDWNSGDSSKGSQLPPYDPVTGLGQPYVRGCVATTNRPNCSPVKWFYEFDSRDFIGGFPVSLHGTWRGTYSISSTSPFDGGYSEAGSLPDRQGTWTVQHVVCQVQTLLIAPGYTPPSVPCRDPRVRP